MTNAMVGMIVFLVLGVTPPPALAQTDGFRSDQIILIESQDKSKKKKPQKPSSDTSTSSGLGICSQPGTSPTQEICGDSLDNDCDGFVDESGCVNN